MRKLISLLLAFAIVLTPILSFAADYSAMTEEELFKEIDQIRIELLKRELNPENIILESDGVIIYFKGDLSTEKYYDDTTALIIPVIVVNNGDKAISASIDKISVNGWEIEDYNSVEVNPGKKAKAEFKFKDVYGKTDITSLSEITEIEFYGSTTDPKTYMYITRDLVKTIVFE